jgi:protocatechuate 3,4-dioxygenase beta subunit
MAISRRRFLVASSAVPLAAALGACDGDEEEAARRPARTDTAGSGASPRELSLTPTCDDGDEPSPEQTEGPFYTPRTPRRRDLVDASVVGKRILLTGAVFDTRCRRVGGALLDFWQADGNGEYDNEGFRLRGHQFADSGGRFRLSTVVPGAYSGRTRHIHVKVQRPGGDVLTTQLYFPRERLNASDGLFDERLVMGFDGRVARFDFVLA